LQAAFLLPEDVSRRSCHAENTNQLTWQVVDAWGAHVVGFRDRIHACVSSLCTQPWRPPRLPSSALSNGFRCPCPNTHPSVYARCTSCPAWVRQVPQAGGHDGYGVAHNGAARCRALGTQPFAGSGQPGSRVNASEVVPARWVGAACAPWLWNTTRRGGLKPPTPYQRCLPGTGSRSWYLRSSSWSSDSVPGAPDKRRGTAHWGNLVRSR